MFNLGFGVQLFLKHANQHMKLISPKINKPQVKTENQEANHQRENQNWKRGRK